MAPAAAASARMHEEATTTMPASVSAGRYVWPDVVKMPCGPSSGLTTMARASFPSPTPGCTCSRDRRFATTKWSPPHDTRISPWVRASVVPTYSVSAPWNVNIGPTPARPASAAIRRTVTGASSGSVSGLLLVRNAGFRIA